MAIEDGATLAECLSRAGTVDQISKAMGVYEAIRKPRAEKLKNASEMAGLDKHYADGEQQLARDEGLKRMMKIHLSKIPGKGVETKHPQHWIMGYDVIREVSAPAFVYPDLY